MSGINRAALRGIKRKIIEVPALVQLNGSEAPQEETFYLRELNARERDLFDIALFKDDVKINDEGVVNAERVMEPKGLRARLVALCRIVHETGERISSDAEFADCDNELPSTLMATLFSAAQKLNGMQAGAVAVAEKNSSSGPIAASSSD